MLLVCAIFVTTAVLRWECLELLGLIKVWKEHIVEDKVMSFELL
jgi:hypothetical protein